MAYPSTTHLTTARPYIAHATIVHQSTAHPTTCHPTTTHRSQAHNSPVHMLPIKSKIFPKQDALILLKKGFVGGGGPVCCFLQQREKDIWKIMKKIESFLVLFMKLEPKT
ncbi:unnamed protein product [Brassica oleracea var. botrytis]